MTVAKIYQHATQRSLGRRLPCPTGTTPSWTYRVKNVYFPVHILIANTRSHLAPGSHLRPDQVCDPLLLYPGDGGPRSAISNPSSRLLALLPERPPPLAECELPRPDSSASDPATDSQVGP